MTIEHDEPTLMFCMLAGNSAVWTIKHSRESDGETFESIQFGSDHVRFSTDSGREVVIPNMVYENIVGDPESVDIHEILEFDSFGNRDRTYVVSAPVAIYAPSFGG